MPKRKVLVTGACGKIAGQVLPALRDPAAGRRLAPLGLHLRPGRGSRSGQVSNVRAPGAAARASEIDQHEATQTAGAIASINQTSANSAAAMSRYRASDNPIR